MFDDFHESTRNVGVVGILLGLLVLAGFCGLGMAVMSGAGKKGPSLESRLKDQGRNMEVAKEELELKKRRLTEIDGFREVAAVLKETDAAKEVELGVIAGLKEEISDLQEEVDSTQLDFEEYRQKYRDVERASAVGEVLDLSETKGEGFQKCKVLSITPLHLRVMLSAGPAGIPYNDLPKGIRDRFQFGQEEAEAFQTKMDAVRANLDQGIANWEKKQKALKGEAAKKALIDRIAQTKKAMGGKLQLSDRLDRSAHEWRAKAVAYDQKANDAKARGNISSSAGLARKARNKADRYSRQADDARLAVNRLLEEQDELERRLERNGR
jgi:hypothetical protein